MFSRYWSAMFVFMGALGLLLWGLSLHPDEVTVRGHLIAPYIAKGLGVIGLIGSMLLFLGAARHSRAQTPQDVNAGQAK
jgi:hypothetical protein